MAAVLVGSEGTVVVSVGALAPFYTSIAQRYYTMCKDPAERGSCGMPAAVDRADVGEWGFVPWGMHGPPFASVKVWMPGTYVLPRRDGVGSTLFAGDLPAANQVRLRGIHRGSVLPLSVARECMWLDGL